MSLRSLPKEFWLLLLCSCFFIASVSAAEVNIEALLADINRRPPEQRLKALIDGAKKEGLVSHYGSTNTPDNDEITRGFTRQYPFIEIRYTRLGAEQVVNRAMTEHRSGLAAADVISMRGTFLPDLMDKKVVVRYKSPMIAFLRKGFTDPEGFVATNFATGYAMIFNTTRVKPAEAPKSYEDLLAAVEEQAPARQRCPRLVRRHHRSYGRKQGGRFPAKAGYGKRIDT